MTLFLLRRIINITASFLLDIDKRQCDGSHFAVIPRTSVSVNFVTVYPSHNALPYQGSAMNPKLKLDYMPMCVHSCKVNFLIEYSKPLDASVSQYKCSVRLIEIV